MNDGSRQAVKIVVPDARPSDAMRPAANWRQSKWMVLGEFGIVSLIFTRGSPAFDLFQQDPVLISVGMGLAEVAQGWMAECRIRTLSELDDHFGYRYCGRRPDGNVSTPGYPTALSLAYRKAARFAQLSNANGKHQIGSAGLCL